MTSTLILIGAVIVICFGMVVLVGAPYLPSFRSQIEQSIKMMNLKPGDTVIDLGSGDGKVMKIMAEHGIKSIGYELNPILFAVAKIRLWPYREYTTLHLRNYMQAQLPPSKGIFIFGYQSFMSAVEKKLLAEAKGRKVVSSIFPFPLTKPVAEKNGIYLYKL